ADRNPSSAVKQLVYYKELNKVGRYSEVIQRVESGKYSTDTSCLQLYVESLVKIGKSDQILQRVGLLAQKEPHLLDQMAKFVDESSLADIGKATANMPSQSFASSSATSSSSSSMQNIDRDQNVRVIVENPQQTPLIWRVLSWIGSTFVYLFVALTFMNILLENSGLIKSAQSTTPNEFQPGTGSGDRVTFSDVQGCDEAKQELEELVEFLKDPKRFTELGGRMPKGVLLTGPPGTGKTLLARAVAGEAGVPFFFMAGSEFDEVYVGLGAKRIRELFAAARRKSPSIVFIDELDAIGAKRSAKDQTYIKQTLNQLLVDLDGFSPSEGVIFIAATNFPEMLDKALVRPGRFDRHVNVPLPDVRGRIQILSLHTKNVPLDPTVDISVIARGTPGFSGADLANLVNHAAIQASRDGSRTVLMRHLDFAKDKILMGAERRSAVVTAESKRRTAYHEGGHALMALRTQGAIPLHKATVMPRGMSLGMTVQLPELDKDSYTRQEYLAMIDVSMGGRIAEELIYGVDHASSGAHNDLQKATQIATQMVTQFGMDETVGLISYSDEERQLLSTPTKQRIEDAIKRLLHESRERTINCLNEHRDDLERLATGLIEFETLSREEIDAILRGE
ncbi:ATP-dependent metallopeptidase Hfl, partial [Ramicandelaber brevisporus]